MEQALLIIKILEHIGWIGMGIKIILSFVFSKIKAYDKSKMKMDYVLFTIFVILTRVDLPKPNSMREFIGIYIFFMMFMVILLNIMISFTGNSKKNSEKEEK